MNGKGGGAATEWQPLGLMPFHMCIMRDRGTIRYVCIRYARKLRKRRAGGPQLGTGAVKWPCRPTYALPPNLNVFRPRYYIRLRSWMLYVEPSSPPDGIKRATKIPHTQNRRQDATRKHQRNTTLNIVYRYFLLLLIVLLLRPTRRPTQRPKQTRI